LIKVEENKAKLASVVPQFGSRLPKQFHIPWNTGLQGHSTTRLFLGHREQSTHIVIWGISHDFCHHLFCLHIPKIRSLTEI